MKRFEAEFECKTREDAIDALKEIIGRIEMGYDCGNLSESRAEGDWGLIDESSNLW